MAVKRALFGKMAMPLLLAAMPLLLPVGSHAATVYKCKNQQGGLSYQETPCKKEMQSVSSWEAKVAPGEADAGENFSGTFTLKQQENGHYYMAGSVNDRSLTFIVDTGATLVSLPRELALSSKIYCREDVLMQTANGATSACRAIIPRLKFGPFFIKDAPATISPNLSQPLLGMSVLQQFRIEQEDGEMRISPRN
ncbi:MAG: TIGR02281 family clan AA aspartic protease [Pseudomonadota bacterium]